MFVCVCVDEKSTQTPTEEVVVSCKNGVILEQICLITSRNHLHPRQFERRRSRRNDRNVRRTDDVHHHESEDTERSRWWWWWKEQGKCNRHVFIAIGVVVQCQSKTVHRSGRFNYDSGFIDDDINNHNNLGDNRWRRTYGKGIASSTPSSSTLFGTIVKL